MGQGPVSLTGRKVGGRCVEQTARNRTARPCDLKIGYRLTAAVKVRLTLQKEAVGRKVHGRCVEATKRNHTHGRCGRRVDVQGRITMMGRRGHNAFVFRGNIGGHSLGPGRYRLTATPVADGHAGTPATAKFLLGP